MSLNRRRRLIQQGGLAGTIDYHRKRFLQVRWRANISWDGKQYQYYFPSKKEAEAELRYRTACIIYFDTPEPKLGDPVLDFDGNEMPNL